MRLWKVVVGIAVLVAIGAAAVVVYAVLTPFGPKGETFVDIAPGTGTAKMAEELQTAGVIRSRLVFEAMKVWRGGVLKAGYYRFAGPETIKQVYGRLRSGDVYTVTVVIPEGFNIFDIADTMAAAGLSPRATFLRAEMEHTELISEWTAGGPKPPSLEGFLFPDTYRFSPKATPVQILTVMVRRFGQVAQELGLRPGAAQLGADPKIDGPKGLSQGNVAQAAVGPENVEGTVTLASLVEKEVHLNAERPLVASVFDNRMAAGMPLQTDPSVIYASLLRGTWTGVIHESELHSDSAYNTYEHAGLPPGPICNPGRAALEAVLHPAKTDYLYFVADAKGATRFAVTLAEQNANVASYRAAR